MIVPVFKPSKQTIILLAVVAGVFLCIGGFAYYMCASSLSTITAECKQKQQEAQSVKQAAQRLKEVEGDFLLAQSDLSHLETSVTSKEYVPTMLKQLEYLGRSLNMHVVSVRPLPLPAPPPLPIKKAGDETASPAAAATPAAKQAALPKAYEELPIEVQIEGSYWDARNFISRLTQFPKIVAVKQVDMSPSDVAKHMGSPKLIVKLQLMAFVFPAQSEQKSQDGLKKQPAPVSVPAKSAMGGGRSHNEG